MNRTDRLTAILIQLQSRRLVRAQDIADRFDISLRTVYRDIKALEESGVPVIGEAGVGYSIMEGYRLPPVMFTKEEAMAFLTAEKLVEKLTDPANSSSFRNAMFKVRAVLRASDKDLLESIDGHIEVVSYRQAPLGPPERNYQQLVLQAVAENKVLLLEYVSNSKQERTRRTIEPLGIFFMDNRWHLVAWCRLRKDYRDFRLDRITSLSIGNETFTGPHPGLKEFLDASRKEHPVEEVVLLVRKRKLRFLGEQKYYMGLVKETDRGEMMEMHFLTPSMEGFMRWYLMLADFADILQPRSLQEKVDAFLDSLVRKRKGGGAT